MNRWRCSGCSRVSLEHEFLRSPSPFNGGDELTACPNCKTVDQWDHLCDEPGCEMLSSCGFPTDAGYRRTCWTHSIWNQDAVKEQGRTDGH